MPPATGPGDFLPTVWSEILHAKDLNDPKRIAALNNLCKTYWKPVYFYTRRKGMKANDAEDATQAFFAWFVEKGVLERVEREGGRFRSFLLAVLDRYLANEYRRERTRKRASGAPILSLDAKDAVTLEIADPSTPEQSFRRQWAETVIARAFDALSREYEECGWQDRYNAVSSHLMNDNERPSYEELGKKLGMDVPAIRDVLQRARQRLRDFIREVVRETVEDENAIEDEINELFDAL